MENTPRQRLESILKIHKGSCFIPESANDFIGITLAAAKMEIEGLVKLKVTTTGIPGITVTKKGFHVKPLSPDEREPQAH